jgi:hypothetical protein
MVVVLAAVACLAAFSAAQGAPAKGSKVQEKSKAPAMAKMAQGHDMTKHTGHTPAKTKAAKPAHAVKKHHRHGSSPKPAAAAKATTKPSAPAAPAKIAPKKPATKPAANPAKPKTGGMVQKK